MLKAALAVGGLAIGLSAAIGIGSKLATGKSQVDVLGGPSISPHEIMLHFDMKQPADEIKDYI